MISHQKMLHTLPDTNIIKTVYRKAKACVKLHDYTDDYNIERDVQKTGRRNRKMDFGRHGHKYQRREMKSTKIR